VISKKLKTHAFATWRKGYTKADSSVKNSSNMAVSASQSVHPERCHGRGQQALGKSILTIKNEF
jgi:hypothetical protein